MERITIVRKIQDDLEEFGKKQNPKKLICATMISLLIFYPEFAIFILIVFVLTIDLWTDFFKFFWRYVERNESNGIQVKKNQNFIRKG